MASTTKKLVIAGVLSVSISSAAYGSLYGFGPAETWVIQQIASQLSTVEGSISAFTSSFGANMQTKSEGMLSAIAVATEQEGLSANVVVDTTRTSAQQLVTAVMAQQQTDHVAKAYLDYNGSTGQGFDPCGTIVKNKSLDIAFEKLSDVAFQTVGTSDVAPGRLVPSQAAAMQARLDLRRSKFCTSAEADAGLCSLSSLPGGDTNAALLFESVAPTSIQSEARKAYLSHVLGVPDEKLLPSAGEGASGAGFLMAKNRKDAILSIPSYSLAMIDAANQQREDLGNRSANEVLKLRVYQYFGGKESEEWASALARQTNRGLLVEAAKMSGLETWIHYKQFEQNQRIQANLAALVIASADRLNAPIQAQYQKVLSETAMSQIK